ncbi:hypothetical protein KW783_03995 [Candidatus Parcubacteria bacterium]|nr:hypothetical protein [Candidatus Parcubacteria bacterium]
MTRPTWKELVTGNVTMEQADWVIKHFAQVYREYQAAGMKLCTAANKEIFWALSSFFRQKGLIVKTAWDYLREVKVTGGCVLYYEGCMG